MAANTSFTTQMGIKHTALKTLEIQNTQYSTVTETPAQDFNVLDISDSQHIILLKKTLMQNLKNDSKLQVSFYGSFLEA